MGRIPLIVLDTGAWDGPPLGCERVAGFPSMSGMTIEEEGEKGSPLHQILRRLDVIETPPE